MSKKRQWLYGDESPVSKRPLLIDSSSDQMSFKAGSCGAAYLHLDAWSYIIQLLRWEDITMLLRTGNVKMRSRVARAARHADIRFLRDGKSSSQYGSSQYGDVALLRLLNNTHEGLNLTSLSVSIGAIRDLKTTAQIISRLDRLEKFSLSIQHWHTDINRFLEGESLINLRIYTYYDPSMLLWDDNNNGKLRTGEPLIRLPSSIKHASLDIPASCKPNYIISFEKCHRLTELCIQTGSSADTNASLPLLTHKIGLIPSNITSLHLPDIDVPQLVYEQFQNLTHLQISLTNKMLDARHASLPPSLQRIVFVVLSDHIRVDHIAQYFVSPDKSQPALLPSLKHIAFVRKDKYEFCAKIPTVDLLTVLSRSTPALETIEDRQSVIKLDSYMMRKDVLRNAVDALSRLPKLREFPLSFIGCLHDFDTLVTEADRMSTLCAVSWSHSSQSVYYRGEEPSERGLSLIKASYIDFKVWVETSTLSYVPQSLLSLLQLSACMLKSVSFEGVLFEASAPLACLKSLPLLKRLCIDVASSLKPDASSCPDDHDELYHWCRASLPVSLETLVLGYADSPTSVANWKKVDNESRLCLRRVWFPPRLERLEVNHIFPDRAFASTLPPGLEHLTINGRWFIAPDQLHMLNDIEMIQASDFFDYAVGQEKWFKYSNMNVSFVGEAWESILKDFVYQFTGYAAWQNAPQKRLKLASINRVKRRLPGREAQETIYNVTI